MTTNVPSLVFTPTGVSIPDEGDVLTGVLADMNTALGGGMSTSLTSPQGQLSTSLSAIIGDKNDDVISIVNAVDPDTSYGRYQDAIGRIYYLERIGSSGTVVTATCGGQAGAVIPVGSLAQSAAGDIYASTVAAQFSASGTVDIPFQCLTTGPIACPAGTLTKIYKAVTGWETVTNASAGTPGTNVESRDDFEYRRRQSVALNALNTVESIRANVLSVANVLDAYVVDNPSAATVNMGATNFPVIAHSIYICVAGGAAVDIAMAIWKKKPPGCDYNGTTTYPVQDTQGGTTPYPTYNPKWVTASSKDVYFTVTITNSSTLPSNIVALVRNAIVAAFNGADGGTRARIGSTLAAGRYYAGVISVDPSVPTLLLSIAIGAAANPTGTSMSIGIDQRPVLDPSHIAVVLA